MPTVHEKLKLAFVHQHPDDGLMLTVTTRTEQKFDLVLTPQAAAMLLGQLTQGVKDALSRMEKLP